MKGKSLTYFLIVVVAALWGGIFYKIFSTVSGEDDKPLVAEKFKTNTTAATTEDTFILLANYRDPFLGTLAREVVNKPRPYTLKKKITVPKKEIDWSFAELIGVVFNSHNKKKIAFINFKGKEVMMNEGEKVEDLTLLKVFKDSAIVALNGNIHVYKRR